MSVNSSSSGDSFLHLHISFFSHCLMSKSNSFIFLTFITTNVFLLLPLCTFIIYHGLQQWWKKRSTSSAAPMSHSDSFTYHLVAMEMIGVCGDILCCCGVYRNNLKLLLAGWLFISITWFGEMFFHVLTCVERYLAVVHPVTYLSLRRERGIRIRNITIGCVWLLCITGMGLEITGDNGIAVNFCLLILSFIIISFCSLSVLRVLIRPGPGEQGGARERVDQSKQKAFYTIVAILGVLVLRFTMSVVWAVLYISGGGRDCVMLVCSLWFNLPSSLVLPLLFLHREGKLMCCRNIH